MFVQRLCIFSLYFYIMPLIWMRTEKLTSIHALRVRRKGQWKEQEQEQEDVFEEGDLCRGDDEQLGTEDGL